jgi:hypothetical protein
MNKKPRFFIAFTILASVLVAMVALANNEPENPSEEENFNARFINVENDKIRNTFIEVLAEYEELHPYEITLIKEELKNSTMQAQPIINFGNLFSGTKRYKVQLAESVRDAEELIIAEVPHDVLKGWFAHELGHIVDYEVHSNINMIGFGLKYTFSDNFKRACEHEADSIAIEHGFHEEIIATKKFILENELVSNEYKAKLRKYYMPIKGVKMCLEKNPPIKPDVEL